MELTIDELIYLGLNDAAVLVEDSGRIAKERESRVYENVV
jgi:hypothetical protein